MFVLYAVPIGLLLGLLRGGAVEHLGAVRLRWGWLAIGGLVAQVLLFSTPLGDLAGDAVPVLYVASTVIVLAAVLANLRLPGLRLVALGAVSNLAAILANGGYMPASADALAAAGMSATDGPTNSIVATNPALAPLTDVFALPDWVPFANVFSIGDVLIGVGIAWAIAGLMQPRADDGAATPSPSDRWAGPVHGGTSPD
jgi:hypothetical protein